MEIEKRLYEAAVVGDMRVLHELLEQDVLILDRLTLTCFNETPLHIAAMRGHFEFVKLILAHSPQLAFELDSRNSSALHIASAKGHLQIVKMLLVANPDMCMTRDRDGRNPLHLAAIKGRVEVIEELTRVRPRAALGTTINGENILHLCVKHNRLEALKVLLEFAAWDYAFLNAKDSDGHTILHLAVADKQLEATKYLLKTNQMDLNTLDETALDILAQSGRNINDVPLDVKNSTNSSESGGPSKGDWISKRRETIMVVASLIATMAFQAGINPPGGVWQAHGEADSKGNPQHNLAGEAVMAYNYPAVYRNFLRANTIAFVSSLSTILLLISGLPFKRRLFMWGLMVIMWLTISSTALTYGISVSIVTPGKDLEHLDQVFGIGIIVWCGLMALLLLGNTIRLLRIWYRKVRPSPTPDSACLNV